MFIAQVENSLKNILRITQNESRFQVLNVSGLNPPKAQINTYDFAGVDGTRFNSARLEPRNIVITLKLCGNVEENRIYLYTFFKTKEWCKLYFKTDCRDVYIEGYVETIECDFFTNKEIMQISVVCPDPYFIAHNELVVDASKVQPNFKFPFSIQQPIPFSIYSVGRQTAVVNSGEVTTGVKIEIDIFNYINKLEVRNTVLGQYFIIDTGTEHESGFYAGDKVIINTDKGHKYVTKIRDSESENIFYTVVRGSSFFQLSLGANYFTYLADSGLKDDSVRVTFTPYTKYRGI